jgi:catechol 2,3-dioxygenase-like lactoylglutathione lyase family enzyme
VSSQDAEADKRFFKDALGFEAVDAGNGWLIFALPPAEVAVHPTDSDPVPELYLMCDDVIAERQRLEDLGFRCGEIVEARWGSVTRIALPGGGEVGLYEPRHPSPVLDRT